MNLIEKLGLGKCKAIVDGAPKWADIFCISSNDYFRADGGEIKCCIFLNKLRTAIANHERTDHCTDIRNHISPLTGVIER